MYEQEIYEAVRLITPPPSLRDKVLGSAKRCCEHRERVVSKRDKTLSTLFERPFCAIPEGAYSNPDYFKNTPDTLFLSDLMDYWLCPTQKLQFVYN